MLFCAVAGSEGYDGRVRSAVTLGSPVAFYSQPRLCLACRSCAFPVLSLMYLCTNRLCGLGRNDRWTGHDGEADYREGARSVEAPALFVGFGGQGLSRVVKAARMDSKRRVPPDETGTEKEYGHDDYVFCENAREGGFVYRGVARRPLSPLRRLRAPLVRGFRRGTPPRGRLPPRTSRGTPSPIRASRPSRSR
jgi:hypothetical protein